MENYSRLLIEGTLPPGIEEKIIRFDGTILDVEITTTMFPYVSRNAIIAVVRDITERKKAEELQKSMELNTQQLTEAVELEKLRTEFFANLSHELRTPLSVIIGTLQLLNLYLNDKMLNSSEKKASKYIGIIKQNCYRLLRLVNNMIDITKLDAGFYEIQLHNHNIVYIVESITLSVAEYIENKGIRLSFDTDIEEKCMACDPDKIERIMLNLLSNAVKYTLPGGNIYVCINNFQDRIRISVKDTGIGIPKEKQEIIFERFRQVDMSLNRKSEGSGIGLSLVKSLVELHGGRIWIESEPDQGSSFIFELPVRLLETEKCCDVNNNYDLKLDEYVQRINIEFSDIYSN